MDFLPNGSYTIENQDGEHRTFKIHTKQGGKYKGSRQVSLLIGQDNENDYQGFGFVDDRKANIYIFRNKRTRIHSWYGALLERANEAIRTVYNSEEESVETSFGWKDRIYKVQMSRRCMRCNRELTDPESIRAGLGPTCRKKQ